MKWLGMFAAIATFSTGRLDAQVGDRWQRQVDSALSRAAILAAGRGYATAAQQLIGSLFLEESETRPIPLAAGGRYLMVAVCDADCRTLHLKLSNPNSDELTVDQPEGNVAVIEVRSDRTGEYRLQVTMQGCRVSPCRYGVAVFLRAQ